MHDPLSAVQRALSKPRFDRYLAATHGDLDRALKLYGHSIRLSAALMSFTHIFEVLLRNRIDLALREDLSPQWMLELCKAAEDYKANDITSASDYLSFLPIGPNDHIVVAALRAKKDALKNGTVNVDQDALVASASFGYWLTILGRRYEATLWRSCLKKTFARMRRVELVQQVESIQLIRNRIAHYEPLIFSRRKSDVHPWKVIADHFYAVRAAIQRIDPSAFLAVEPLLDCSHVVRDLAEPFQIDMSRLHIGRLPRFSPNFAYMFIECDAFERPLYCQRSSVSNLLWTQLYPGRTVQFLVTQRSDGRPFVETLLDVLPATAPVLRPTQTLPPDPSQPERILEPIAAES